MRKVDEKELFEMDLYYREVIGKGDAPAEVKMIDIIKLLDHVAAMESELEVLRVIAARKSDPPKRRSSIQGGGGRLTATEVPAGQTDIFDYIGGDE